MPRVFVDTELAGEDAVVITGDTAHHLFGVLRSRPGDRFVAIDPSGRECEAIVESCARGEVRGRIVAVHEPTAEPTFRLELYQALLKGKNLDLVLQKCTELGVSRFVPVITERTIPRLDEERVSGRVERWRKIVEEACRQCGRNVPPEVSEPLNWLDAVAEPGARDVPGLLPYEELAGAGGHGLRKVLEPLRGAGNQALALFIGPEGGFTKSEIAQARSAGLQTVSLGPRVLRAETAAITTCAIIMYELGDW